MAVRTKSIFLKTEEETNSLAIKFAEVLIPGDTVLLFGDLGVGKSSFARSFIRHRFGAEIEVPSPTFTLVQTYEHGDGDIWHCDLYRLSNDDETLELGLEEAFADAICLIEWPERVVDTAPSSSISVRFEIEDDGRKATICGTNSKLETILASYD